MFVTWSYSSVLFRGRICGGVQAQRDFGDDCFLAEKRKGKREKGIAFHSSTRTVLDIDS